ncbi:MAG: fibronectin type III domain-containing protein [Paludibacteraceae bacterium]|nr:fibronectin type III domain-containing protein [Paludibacteraceae bacterium]
MKKSLQRLLSVAALLILAIGGSWLHAETVTVGEGTSTNTSIPVNGLWIDASSGCTSEFIIPSDELDEVVNGSISKLTFYLSASAAEAWTGTFQVYLAEVEYTTLSGIVGMTDATVVYTGLLNATASTMEIEFNQSYTYGGGNLLVGIDVQVPGNYKSATFLGVTATGAAYHRHNTSNSAQNFLPKTTIEYEPGGAVSCEKPVDFVVANVASHSADLSWSSSASSFELVLSTEGANDVISVVTDTFTSLSNLSDNTAYTVSVRAICQVGDSSRIVKKSFTTPCDPLAILMLTEGFEDVENTLGCWRYSGGTLGVSTSTYNIHAGAQSLSMNGGAPASPMYLVLPPVDATLLTSARLRFWYKQSSTGATYPHFTIGSMSNPGDTSTFVAIKELDRTSTFTEAVADFNEIPAGHTYMVIKFAGGTYSTYGYIDDVEILPMPDCMEPTNLTLDAVGMNEATLSWSPRGEEEMWQYLCIPSNQTPDWENFELAEDTVIELEGLVGDTEYTFYLKADCGDGLSEAISISFGTGYCKPAPTSVDGGSSAITAIAFGGVAAENAVHTTTAPFYNNNSGISFDVAAGTMAQVDITFSTSTYPYGTVIWVDLNKNLEFEDDEVLFAQEAPSGTGVQNCSFLIPASTAEGQYRLRIGAADSFFNNYISNPTANHAEPCGTSTYTVYEDYTINVTAAPDCLQPSDLTIDSLELNAAKISWTPAGSATSWYWVCALDSIEPDWANAALADTTFAVMENLVAKSNYVFYVSANCGADTSAVSSIAFFNGYCTPAPSSVDKQGITGVMLNGEIPEGEIHASAAPYYTDNSAISFETPAGTPADVAVVYGTGYTYGTVIWVDWNKNLEFEEDEVVFAGQSTNANPTTFECPFLVPSTTPEGSYSMRIGGADNFFDSYITNPVGKVANPCNSGTYLVYEDYTLIVTEAPSCWMPSDLNVASVGADSAVLVWTAGNNETQWQYAVVAEGDSIVWDADNIVASDSIVVTGLNANSAYTFYVRAYCSVDDQSIAIHAGFRTECAEVEAIPYAEDFEGDGFNCWLVGNLQTTSSYYIPSIGTSYKYEGSYGLRLNAYDYVGSNSSTHADSALAILPALDYVGGIQQYRVQFYAKAGGTTASSSTNYNQNLYVGIVDDSISTFTLVEAVTMNGSTFTDFQVNLSNFNGIGGHIAFLAAVDTASTASTRYGQFYIDNVRVSLIPSCTRPDSLQVTNLVQDTVAFAWQAGGSETQWQWVYAVEGAEPDWANATLTEVPHAEINGWNVNTNYKFYVRAYCSAQDQSEEAVAAFYFGYCQPAPTSVDGSNGAITAVALQGVAASAAVHTLVAPFYNNNSAISFEVPAATDAQVDITFATGSYPYGTVIWVDWNNNLEFEESEVVFAGQASTGSGVMNCSFAVPATQAEGAYRMRIGAADSFFDNYISNPAANTANPCNSGTYCVYEDYTLVVTAAPSCLTPINLSVVELTANYVELGWEPAVSATPYQFALVAEGDSLVWNPLNVIELDTASFGELTANSDYTFYVRAYCSESDQSAVAMISFHTPCAAIVGLPWAEDFDSLATGSTSAVAPECWNILGANNGSYPYVYVTATHTPLGAKSLFLESNSSGPAYAVLPQLEDLSNAQISFSYKYESPTAGGDLLFGYMTNPADETSFVALTTCARSTAWANVEELALTSVPAGAALAFKLNAPSYYFYYAMVDDIVINELPNCQKPTDLILADLSETGAAIAWAGHGNELGWNWICCLDTVEPDWTAFNTVDSAFAVIDNLQPNTNYIFYVKAACGEADFSDVVSLSFYTGYCLPAPSSVDGSGITAIAFGGTVVDNAAHASSAPFFTDNTAIAYQVAPGANALIDIYYATDYSYGTVIWVDWNKNLVFEENEVMFTGTSAQLSVDTLHCSFAVPAAQEQGAYRMRIGGADSFFDSFINGSADYSESLSCSDGYYRLYEDYTLQVTGGPSTDIWAIFGDTENRGVKFVRDGHIYILRNGIIYDATGRKVEVR